MIESWALRAVTVMAWNPGKSGEQKALEDSLNTLLNDVNANKKALQKLDKDLLQRLTESQGNLLDDTSLMEVLNNTKTQAK